MRPVDRPGRARRARSRGRRRAATCPRPSGRRHTRGTDRRLPITEHLSRITTEFATQWWHWFFFAQPDIPERVINADPDSWYRGDPHRTGHENHDERRAAMRDPDVVRAMLEDYRAVLTIDRRHEDQDRANGIRIQCPALILWSLQDDLEDLYRTHRVRRTTGHRPSPPAR
jgi:hypothetical protein